MAFGILLALALPARAQITDEPPPFKPDRSRFAQGVQVDGEMGALIPLGDAKDHLLPGLAVGARLGYDLLPWFAVQGRLLGSTHQVDFAGPQRGELLQFYLFGGEGRITIPFGQTALALHGGGGLMRLSNNILGTTGLTDEGVRTTPWAGGGLALDYHTLTRRFSVGLSSTYMILFRVPQSAALMVAPYLRYTF